MGAGMILTNRKGHPIDHPDNVEESASRAVKKEIRILMLEDNVADAELIRFALREGGLYFSLKRVDSKTAFLKELQANTPDVILLDYALPGFDGFSALSLAQETYPDIPFIFLTGTLGEAVANDMLKSGATR